jgi:hypothetical protein
VPAIFLDRAAQALPDLFYLAQQARAYNTITGANLSHLDLMNLGIFERDQIDLLIANVDLII